MNIDWFTFVAQILNFAVLVYVLSRFLYGPITRAMAQREETIAARLEKADLQQREAAIAEARFDKLSTSLEHQRSDLFEQAQAEADLARKKLVQEARAEIQARRDEWQQSLLREQSTLINLVRERAGQQVVAISRSALSRLADVELEEQTIMSFLRKLPQFSAEQNDRIKQDSVRNQRIEIRTGFGVADALQQELRAALKDHFGFEQVTFATSEEMICGIELHVGGSKIGWSIREYLESLADELEGMWVKE